MFVYFGFKICEYLIKNDVSNLISRLSLRVLNLGTAKRHKSYSSENRNRSGLNKCRCISLSE